MNQKVWNINIEGFHACILLAQVYTGSLDIRFSVSHLFVKVAQVMRQK